MDVDLYLKSRSELLVRALSECQAAAPTRDLRFYMAGVLCIAAAPISVLWAAATLTDPGLFARTTNFMTAFLLVGAWVVTGALIAGVLHVRTAVHSNNAVRERTLLHMMKIDGSIAHKALQRNT